MAAFSSSPGLADEETKLEAKRAAEAHAKAVAEQRHQAAALAQEQQTRAEAGQQLHFAIKPLKHQAFRSMSLHISSHWSISSIPKAMARLPLASCSTTMDVSAVHDTIHGLPDCGSASAAGS